MQQKLQLTYSEKWVVVCGDTVLERQVEVGVQMNSTTEAADRISVLNHAPVYWLGHHPSDPD